MVKKTHVSIKENNAEKLIDQNVPESKTKPEGFNSKEITFNDIQPTGNSETVESDSKIPKGTSSKRRGRPPKHEKEAETQEQVLKITEDIFTPVFKLLNKILSAKFSPVVTLDNDEITSMKFYLALVANKYLPSVVQKFGAEFTLGILTLTITADKVIKYQEWKAKQHKTDETIHRQPSVQDHLRNEDN